MKPQSKKTKPQNPSKASDLSPLPKQGQFSYTSAIMGNKAQLSWQAPANTPEQILEAQAAKSPRAGRHSCSSAQTFMFLWAGWTTLARTAKGSCFPANSQTLASKCLGGKKNLHPRLSFGFKEASQNEAGKVGVIIMSLQLPMFMFCSQRTNSTLSNAGSKCLTGARNQQNLQMIFS